MHEQEETDQRCNAKAQRDHECHCHCLLMQEGSENEDEDNSDEGQDLKEDGLEEEEDTQVGRPITFFFVCRTDRISCSV